MMPAHGGFDLRRDHGFRNPPFLPFQVPGAPAAWQQGTAAPPSWSDNRHKTPQSTASFNFRRGPASWGPPEAHLRRPYQPPQTWAEGRGAAVGDTNIAHTPRRNSAAAPDGSSGGDVSPGDSGRNNGGADGETKEPVPPSPSPSPWLSSRNAYLGRIPRVHPRQGMGAFGSAAGDGGFGRSFPSSSSALDAVPASDRVQEGGGEGEQAEGGREPPPVVAEDALQPAEAATNVAAASSAVASASASAAASAEGRSPFCGDQVHSGYDKNHPPGVIAPGVEAASPRIGGGGRIEEAVQQQRYVFEAGAGNAVEEQDEEEEEKGDPELDWAMSKEWEDHLQKSPSVQRYLQRMQAKPSTWKDWRGGKKGNKNKSGKKSAAGGGGGGGGGSSSSVGATADNDAEKQVSKGNSKKMDKISIFSSSKEQQKQQQQQQQQQKTPGEKKGGKKKPKPSSRKGRTAIVPVTTSPVSSVTAAKQALELELAKIEAQALLYANQQQHRHLEDAVIPSELTLF